MLPLLAAACSGSEQQALELAAQAQAQADAGDLVSARRTMAAAIAERDDIAALYLQRGRIALRAKAYLEAYVAYSEALTLDATNMEALQVVAQLALASGRNQEAEEAADRILALQPSQPDAKFLKGLVQLARRQPQEADKQADEILASAPGDERGLALKARVMYATGQTDRAISLLETNSDPATRREMLSRTLIELYREGGRAEPALAELSRLIARNPDDVDSSLDRAMILYKTDRIAEARLQTRQLLARERVSAEVLDKILGLWSAYDPDPLPAPGAMAIQDEEARLAVARFYLLQQDHDRALAWLEGSRSPSGEALRLRIAMSKETTASGARAASEILARDDTQCDALLARSIYQRSAGRLEGAIRDAQRAVAECPADPGAVLELAKAYRARRDLAAEFRVYDKGLGDNPQSLPLTRAYFARSLEARDLERARAVARRLTRAAPSLEAGWAMLVQACSLVRDAPCLDAAKAGLAQARSSFKIDSRPGELDRRGAFAKLQK